MATEQTNPLRLETKILNVDEGVVEAVVAVTNNKDDGGDVIEPGAATWDEKRLPKVLVNHDTGRVAGKTLSMHELAPGDSRLPVDLQEKGLGAVLATVQVNLDKQDGRELLSDLKFHGDYEWSIGYETKERSYKSGVRHLEQIAVRENSVVPVGMNRETRTLAIKSAAEEAASVIDTAIERAAIVVGELKSLVAELADEKPEVEQAEPEAEVAEVKAEEPEVEQADELEEKAGRRFATRNVKRLKAMRKELDAMLSEIEGDDEKSAEVETEDSAEVETQVVALDPESFDLLNDTLAG